MTRRSALWTLIALLVASTVTVAAVQEQLTGSWLAFGVHPDVLAAVEHSLEDQKELARLDPRAEGEYRRRFTALETLRGRLRILAHSRERILGRYGLLLAGALGLVVATAGGVTVARRRRDAARLERLGQALADLCAGRTDLDLGDPGRDVIGRVAAMVEDTSRVVALDRRRLEQLENLSAWQEAARRHAHEMRTPLTAARLEVERLRDLSRGSFRDPLSRAADNLSRELARLAEFTRGFAEFARLPRPRLARLELGGLVAEMAHGFGEAWPGMTLEVRPGLDGPWWVAADRDLLVQVLVNLADNAAQAGAGRLEITLAAVPFADGPGVRLTVRDDGPGVPPELVPRLFEPYVTTRPAREGLGLGLAISKKILLDHGGELEYGVERDCRAELEAGGEHTGEPGGAVFRLELPALGPEEQPGAQTGETREEMS